MIAKGSAKAAKGGYLDGQMLIAMPTMSDPRFERTLIYLCAHSADGAMGIVVNKPASHITFSGLLDQLDIKPTEGTAPILPIHIGGPVETARGFVLHSSEYFLESCTLPIDGGVSLTATIDVLRAIASGSGPAKALLALGYAGWAPGQLETEIHANGWLHCEADGGLIFDDRHAEKYHRALAKIGVDPSMLVGSAGHA
jgi:putative transcriptional regulator